MATASFVPVESIAEAVGGGGLFVFGMKTMSEGLQRLASDRFKSLLGRAVATRFSAALLGTCLSSALQSSSSASILVVGFLNAGLLSLYQALAVLLGTAAGSAIAVQFIAFRSSTVALIAIFVGTFLKSLSKRRSLVSCGELLLGAGLLFLGLKIMESGLVPISQVAMIRSLNEYVFSWRISAVLFGTLIAFVAQSVSLATGIVIALCGSGLISFAESVGMVIGSNLGIALITLVAAIGGTEIARRAALLNLLINFLAVLIATVSFPLLIKSVMVISPALEQLPVDILLSSQVVPGVTIFPRLIANSQTLFSILMVLLFLPFIGFIARAKAFTGKAGDVASHPAFLDKRVLNTPTIAMLQARGEIYRMSGIAAAMFDDLVRLFYRFDARRIKRIVTTEGTLDSLHKDISSFLVLLSRQELDTDIATSIPELLQLVSQLESLGDQNMKLLGDMQKKKSERIHFSNPAMADLKRLAAAVGELVQLVDLQQTSSGEYVDTTTRLQRDIDAIAAAAAEGHIARMKSGHCSVEAGILFTDMVATLQTIAGIAVAIIITSGGKVEEQ